MRSKSLLIVAALGVVCANSMAASTIIGGSNTIDIAKANQLATWLGEGDLVLTRIFAHTIGDGKTATSADGFHPSVDGKGRTFTVITTDGSAMIGGYNPLSWNTSEGYHIANTPAEQTAFLFNITGAPVKFNERSDGLGPYQTYNAGGIDPVAGPTFGAGFDLATNSTLNSGSVNAMSYGAGAPGPNLLANFGQTNYNILFIDTFQIGSPVPEPASILALGLGGLIMRRRRKNRAA
jgi:hypothetical protein